MCVESRIIGSSRLAQTYCSVIVGNWVLTSDGCGKLTHYEIIASKRHRVSSPTVTTPCGENI